MGLETTLTQRMLIRVQKRFKSTIKENIWITLAPPSPASWLVVGLRLGLAPDLFLL